MIRRNLIIIVFFICLSLYQTVSAQSGKFILHDDTKSIDVKLLVLAAQPLLNRNINVVVYAVNQGCEPEFEQKLSDDNLLVDNQLKISTVAIFFPIPKNSICTIIQFDPQLEAQFLSVDPDIISKGFAPYLADRTPRIDEQLLGTARIYSDSQALARILDSIDQMLWVIENKSQISSSNYFVYDFRHRVDQPKVRQAAQPLLDKGFNVDIFIGDDNSPSVTTLRNYLGLNSEHHITTSLAINLFTNTNQWTAVYSNDLKTLFQEKMAPVLQKNLDDIKSGNGTTYTDLFVNTFNVYANASKQPDIYPLLILGIGTVAITLTIFLLFIVKRIQKNEHENKHDEYDYQPQ